MTALKKESLFSYFLGIMVSFFLFSGYLNILFFSKVGANIDIFVYAIVFLFSTFMMLESRLKMIMPLSFLILLLILFVFIELFSYQFRFFNFYDFDKIKNFLLIVLVSMFIASYYSIRPLALNELSKSLAIFAFFISILMFITFKGNTSVDRLGQEGANPIWIARISGVAILYSFLMLYWRKGNFLFYIIMCLGSSLVMFLASSRGPLISTILCILLFLMFNEKVTFKVFFKYFKYVFLVLASLFFMPATFTDRFTRLADGNFDNNDLSRFELLSLAGQLFNEQIFGRGIGSFSLYSYFPYPHNLVMEYAVELGIVFLLVFIALAVFVCINSLKLLKGQQNKGVVFFILFMFFSFINSMFSGDMISPKEFYISFFTLLLISLRVSSWRIR